MSANKAPLYNIHWFFRCCQCSVFSTSTFYETVVQLIKQALVVIVQPGKSCVFVGALWQLWQQMCWLVSGAANEHCTKQMSHPPALSPASLSLSVCKCLVHDREMNSLLSDEPVLLQQQPLDWVAKMSQRQLSGSVATSVRFGRQMSASVSSADTVRRPL